MIYNWDIEEINKFLKINKILKKNNNDDYLTDYDNLVEIKNILINKNFNLKPLLFYFNKTRYFSKYTLEYILDDYLKYSILNSLNYVKDILVNEETFILKEMDISNENLLELSKDFFKFIPNFSHYDEILKILNPSNKSLRIQDYYNGYSCIFLIDHPYNKAFILLERDNSLNDLLSLNHELAHSIYTPLYTPISYLHELEGTFFEQLTLEFLKDKISKEYYEKLKYDCYFDNIDNLYAFYIHNVALKLKDNKKRLNIKNFIQEFANDEITLLLEKEDLINVLNISTLNYACYAFSFLVSLDLKNLMDKDLEKAYYEFEAIRTNKEEDLFTNLKKHSITFFYDGYENLQKEVATLKRIKLKY